MYRTNQNEWAGEPSRMDPTEEMMASFSYAYDFFNTEVFHNQLPPCVLTVQRWRKGVYGYFMKESWEDHQKEHIRDEIALNPDWIHARPITEVLSTLCHEQVHLKQHHDPNGKSGKRGYHNKQWARMMRTVGLIPSDTGRPGGLETGRSVSHYIEEGGAFQRACQKLLATGFVIPWHTVTPALNDHDQNDDDDDISKKKRESKSKYSCRGCRLNIWAKPKVRVLCVDCEQELVIASS